MKKLLTFVLCALLVLAMAGCNNAEKTAIRVGALQGPTGIGMVKLMDDDAKETAKNDYTFTIAAAADEISGKLLTGELDIAAVPSNLAAVLFNKSEGEIQMLAANTLGVLYILENGNTIQSVEDLRGKTIYASGQGTVAEYAFNYVLTQNGIDPEKDITIEYKAEHAELATLMASGEVDLAILPVPHVTSVLTKNADVRVALDVTELWNEVSPEGSELVMGCVVVRKTFAEENPQAVQNFLEEYANSVTYVNGNVKEAAQMVETYGVMPSAAVAEKAIPDCNIVCLTGEEMKAAVNGTLQVLFDANPASVGGSMPGEDLYYTK